MRYIQEANKELARGNKERAQELYNNAIRNYAEIAPLLSSILRIDSQPGSTDFSVKPHDKRGAPSSGTISPNRIKTSKRARIAIYTAIIGGYDEVDVPMQNDPEWDFIVFTDQPSPSGRDDHEIRQLYGDAAENDPTRIARFIKTHPHVLLSEYEASLWIDGNVSIKPDSLRRLLRRYLRHDTRIALRKHPDRNEVLSELKKCHELRKDDLSIMYKQVARYLREEPDYHAVGLYESNVIFRSHKFEDINTFNERWWDEIFRGSRRDQLSLSYCLGRAGISPSLFPESADIRDNKNKYFSLRSHRQWQAREASEGETRVLPTSETPREAIGVHGNKDFDYQTYNNPFPGIRPPTAVRNTVIKLKELGLERDALRELKSIAGSSSKEEEKLFAQWFLSMERLENGQEQDLRLALKTLQELDTYSQAALELKRYIRFMVQDISYRLGIDLHSNGARYKWSESIDEVIQSLIVANGKSEIETLLNTVFSTYGLQKIRITDGHQSIIDRISVMRPLRREQYIRSPHKVSIIMPCFRASETVETAALSILSQTWENLELIAVDDHSSDDTVAKLERLSRIDPRLKIVQLNKNSGPYIARNIGLNHATGEFLTVCDSDDWSHPQKVQLQVLHLLQNSHMKANTACWFRCTPDLKPCHRFNQPYYKHINISSLMIRRADFINHLGAWDHVRVSGDSECYKRLIACFSRDAVVNLDAITSISRVASESLTNSSNTAYRGFPYGARKEYLDSYSSYHNRSQANLKYNEIQHAYYTVPRSISPSQNGDSGYHFDMVIGGDFRLPDHAERAIDYIHRANLTGERIGLFQLNSYGIDPRKKIIEKLRQCLSMFSNSLLVYGESVSTQKVMVLDVGLLDSENSSIPKISTRSTVVVMHSETSMTPSQRSNLITVADSPCKQIYESPLSCFCKEDLSRRKIEDNSFRYENLRVVKTSRLDTFDYKGSPKIAIIMPSISLKKAVQTSKLLLAKAGIECTVIVALDDLGLGFIGTLNNVAKKTDSRFVCYLAQDAYPGKDWLAHAFDDIEKLQAGLLGFNDGKWDGRIASFGLVRRDWISQYYGDSVLHPSYRSHKADNEITVLAKIDGSYVFSERSVLMEVDYKKGISGKGSNARDDDLFKHRFLSGFDGLVDPKSCERFYKEYKIKPLVAE